jgi:hypothetical protein
MENSLENLRWKIRALEVVNENDSMLLCAVGDDIR